MVNLLDKVENAVGISLLGIITFLVFIAAVMRFFGSPLIWSVDLAQLLFIWLCFFGAAKAMRERSHLGVDFLVRHFSHRGRLMTETALSILFAVFLLVLAWEGYKLTLLNFERLFGDSGLSYAWVTIAVPAGCLLLLLSMVINLADAWRNHKNKDAPLIYTRTASGEGASGAEL